jgi:glutamyl-tRNA synthetase
MFVKDLEPDVTAVVAKHWDAAMTATALTQARRTIADVGQVSWEADEIEPPLRRLVEERGWKAGDLFMAIRVAITGRTVSPPLFDTMVALGYEGTLARLDRAIDKLATQAASA